MSEGLGSWPAVRLDPDDFTELAGPSSFVDLLAQHQRALREQMRAEAVRQRDEWWARDTRLYWSGRPDEATRQILRAFNVKAGDIGLTQRSAFSSEYRRRQRARVKRRRR